MPGNELRWVQFFSRVPYTIITCSKAVSQSLLKSSPRLSRKVKMIYNPSPRWTADPLPNAIDPQGPYSGKGSDVLHVAIIGRITPFKGQLTFIDAARLILQQSRRYHFWIIGSPLDDDSGDRAYLEWMQDAIQEAEIQDHVSFVPHQLDMGPYYQFLDIIVIASQGPEAFGMVALEAMCFGKALVVPSEGGIAELVEDQKTALVMPRATPSDIASRVIELGEDNTKRFRLGADARKDAKDRFSSESFGQAISEILEAGTLV